MDLHQMSVLYIFFTSILTLPKSSSAYQMPLTGPGWTLEPASRKDSEKLTITETTVPGDVYSDLYRAGKIEDPYYRDNDVKLRWIAKKNWTYSKTIYVPSMVQSKSLKLLRADGLDTLVDISLNGRLIGQGSNMFREYLFPLPNEFLDANSNVLKFEFRSTIPYGAAKFAEHKEQHGYSVGLSCRSELEHGECHANFVRKMQASYGWDWGPAFPTMGVWKFLSIEAIDVCYLKRFSAVPAQNGARWDLHAEFFLYCADKVDTVVEFCIQIDEFNTRECWLEKIDKISVGPKTVYRRLRLREDTPVEYWWPNGHGPQRLYEIVGSFLAGDDTEYRVLKIGFRHVQLIEDPVFVGNLERGLTFYTKINGVPIFLKGANWIPGDSFQTRFNADIDRLEFYFRSINEANMNCIRIWGGGVYESDLFYSLADRYGISILHDMMFAVNLYPSTEAFLSNVRSEIEDQINRLKYHPSIILWFGNNENEVGLLGNWYHPMDAPGEIYEEDYMHLYNSTIWDVINRTDFYTRPYVLSSPSNGLQSIREGGLSRDLYSNLFGDTHFYNYDGDSWNWTKYPIPRCVTEYGFLAMPHLETLRTALDDSDLEYFSEQRRNRNHHDSGTDTLREILMQFDFFGCTKPFEDLPNSNVSAGKSCSYKGRQRFDDIIYLSQIHQALALKTETEHYRRWRSMLNEKGEGLTMCALFWQLNDIWQAPSWSSIDYAMKWKASHYEAKKFFASLIVSPYEDYGGNLKVILVNDMNQNFQNLHLIVQAMSWTSFDVVTEFNMSIDNIQATSSAVVYETPISSLKNMNGTDIGILNFIVIDSVTNEEMTPNNVMYLQKFKTLSRQNFGRVSIDSIVMEALKVARIDLVATGIAPFVWLDVVGIRGFFTENAFTMLTKRHRVRFIAWENTNFVEISGRLTLKTLGDIYRNKEPQN